MKGELSIAVTTCGALPYAVSCLNSLKQNTTSDAHILLVDNGSSRPVGNRLARLALSLNISYHRLPENHGPGIGRIAAWKHGVTDTQFVAFLDDDVIVTPGWAEPLLEFLRTNATTAQVAPIMVQKNHRYPYNDRNAWEVWCEIKEQLGTPEAIVERFLDGKAEEVFLKDYVQHNALPTTRGIHGPPEGVPGATFIVRRGSVERAGGISDPLLTGLGNEDIDLTWRLCRAGYRAYVLSSSFVHHFRHVGSLLVLGKTHRRQQYLRGNRLFLSKWHGAIREYSNQMLMAHGVGWYDLPEAWFFRMLQESIAEWPVSQA